MYKRKLLSILLVICLFTSMISVCFTASSGVTTSTGIEYNESRLHTMDDLKADAYIPSTYDQYVDESDPAGDSAGVSAPSIWWPDGSQATTVGFTTDNDVNYGQVLKYTGGVNCHFGFEDFVVKKDRKYYIYFDAKSETADAQAVTLIGVNGTSNSVSRIFFSGYESRNTGVKFYIDGVSKTAAEFKYSTEWQRYGVVLDTSNEALLADITNVNGSSFWDKSIHFQLGVQNATVYFDNIQLIEIQSFPDAVADETNVSADVSVRYPKTENENNGSYLSAGLRFRGSISDEIKSTADEIGFILTPSVYACENQDWYKISNGVNKNVRSAPCYIKDKMDVIYESKDGYTDYQVILSGLSTADGKTSYIHRYSAAMYVKSGNTYSYYSLGETSFNEVCAKYYTLNLKSRHINSGVELVLNGVTQKSNLTVGEKLPALNSYLSDAPSRHKFLGWYDENLTLYATVPNNVDKLYGVFERHSTTTFDTGAYYNANGNLTNDIVDDPFGGNGKVLKFELNQSRGFIPLAIDGISTKAFDFEIDQTYKVSFKYRFADGTSPDAKSSLQVWGTSGTNVTSTTREQITNDYHPQFSSDDLNNTGDWTEFVFTVTNTTVKEYPYLYMRFTGNANTGYTLYIDDFSISDMRTTYTYGDEIKLVNGGNVETTELKVGDTLPTPEKGYDPNNKTYFKFDGWYDETLTTKYTEVAEGVTIYYAKFNNFTSLSFEVGGLYDPNNKYNSVPGGITSWYRAPDPTGADNICMMANLSNNDDNTRFSPSLIEGINQGYTLKEDCKYIISFDYYLSTEDPNVTRENFQIRGRAQDTIGTNKSGSSGDLANQYLETVNEWDNYQLYFQADGVTDCPNIIFMCKSDYSIPNYYLYIDNLKIFEYPYDSKYTIDNHIGVDTEAENVTLNDNGEVTIHNDFVIGSEIPAPTNEYDGATFVGWYNDLLNVPYKTIQGKDTTLYAKYDANVVTFENGVMYDPNNKFANDTRVKITTDPTNSKNSVMMINLNGSGANHHFAVCESSYSANGYKLTVGNTYTITYKYYAENLNRNGVSLQFVGCAQDNIGSDGGKSSSYGNTTLLKEKEWTTVSVTFTYDGSNLTAETSPYLLIQLQDGSAGNGASDCTATVYLDNIVIKESKPEKTYTKKTVKVNGTTLGAYGVTHNIVVPDSGFSYVAMMQLEELVTTIKNITNTSCDVNIVYEKDWTQANNQFNIFVGDLSDNITNKIATSDFTDVNDYKISYGNGNISIGGGSPYALAMAISELNKTLDVQDSSTINLSGTVIGKYSDKIDSYSSESYYRPTFLEDFNGTELNTGIWNIIEDEEEKSTLEGWMSKNTASQIQVKDGNLVIDAAYDENNKMFYGGHIRTHGNMDYRYGYLEVRCRIPDGAGLWSAAWVTSRTDVLGFYRTEIDVFECFCNAQYATFNTHSWPTTAGKYRGHFKYALQNVKKDGKAYERKADSGKEAGFNDGFHTFGLLWTSNSLTYIVDGKVQLVYNYDDTHTVKSYENKKEYTTITNNDYDAFNEKMSPIISMSAGKHETSIAEPGAEYWNISNEYIVDYVHIYQIDGQEIYFTSP